MTSQLDTRGWGRCCEGHHVESGKLCPQLACGLIKMTHLIPADGGITETEEGDCGATSREGCLPSGDREGDI